MDVHSCLFGNHSQTSILLTIFKTVYVGDAYTGDTGSRLPEVYCPPCIVLPICAKRCVVLSPSFPNEAFLRYLELMNAGLPSAMFTSVFTATHQRDDVNRSHLQIVSDN